jgi:hypothetical protein
MVWYVRFVVPYLGLVTRNGLAIGVEGEVFRYRRLEKADRQERQE